MNLFDVLNKMNAKHVGSVHAYFSNNIENLNAGKKGWGSLKIAITSEDAQELMNGTLSGHMTKTVMLFIVDKSIMEQVQKEDELNNTAGPVVRLK